MLYGDDADFVTLSEEDLKFLMDLLLFLECFWTEDYHEVDSNVQDGLT